MKLEYKIGKVEIESSDDSFLEESHKFLVQLSGNCVSIYVAPSRKDNHIQLAKKFGLDKKEIVGGGFIYVDAYGTYSNNLILQGPSHYNTIPEKAALKFGKLILTKLKKDGTLLKLEEQLKVKIEDVTYLEKNFRINEFWAGY